MAQIETLGILDEIQVLVSDKLQVVSYKWLSRNFLVPSNVAKRLLEQFVDKHGSGLEVVYSLSGWLKSSPPSYHIKLVTGPKLSEAKREFDGSCSVQVYSVQACIPKDPAALWNAEFSQAEELFRQPPALDNCLRDNRFCRISNSFVKRNVEGTTASISSSLPKSTGVLESSKLRSAQSNMALPPQQNNVNELSSNVGLQSSSAVKDLKNVVTGKVAHDHTIKSSADKEKIPSFPSGIKKGQTDRSSSRSGGSLANLWGRASTKSKTSCAPEDDSHLVPNPDVSADAQISASEAVEDGNIDDDDAQDVKFKRASNSEGNRKRRVVFDFSDEDENEDAVNLASPDPPKRESCTGPKQLASDISNSTVDKQEDNEHIVKEERTTNLESNQSLRAETSVVNKTANSKTSYLAKIGNQLPETGVNKKDDVKDGAPNSPKRRKLLKTRIDERGREVTEVVWEGEETEMKNAEGDVAKKAASGTTKGGDSKTVTNAVNRPTAAKKSPAIGNTAPSNPGDKAGNKKTGNVKDPKQGNILSFFKRV